MTAEVLKFPHRRSHVIKSLLETAKRLEESSPETCIAIQGQVIAMMSEVAQSRRPTYAAMKAISAMSEWSRYNNKACREPFIYSLSALPAS